MQAASSSSLSQKFVGKERSSESYGRLIDDFGSKLKIDSTDDDDREEGDGVEFSFGSVNVENSPITADEAFEDGQIRPIYPLFNRNLLFHPEEKIPRSPLKKLFVENEQAVTSSTAEESEPTGPYCSWSSKTVEEVSPETCRKSNSTGFSKLWRFRDLVLRSKSDGKDAFVFLNLGDSGKRNHSSSSSTAATKVAKKTEKGKEKMRTEKKIKAKSAHERLYMRNRAIKEEGKRRSYLPYKHVGFFTNVNGLTRNVHPF